MNMNHTNIVGAAADSAPQGSGKTSLLHSRASELTTLAHELLINALEVHGNGISKTHDFALWQLLSGFTDQGLGILSGRFAYALPCGSGKTLSVVAWIAAQHRLGLGLSIAVSAQQIDSLCVIKTNLIDAGVPETLIGIRHTKGSSAAWPDTGEEDRAIMLGSHARIQGKDSMPIFCTHKGAARDLLIWDESLIASEVTTLQLKIMETALSHFADQAKRPCLSLIRDRVTIAVNLERDAQNAQSHATCMVLISEEESDSALAELGHPYCSSPAEAELLNTVRNALGMLKHSVSLLNTGSGSTGEGLMRYIITVSPQLKNIAVLDASFAVRELCKADESILDGTTEAMRNFKNYANVNVKQTCVSSGKYQFSGRRKERVLALDAAVESIISIPPSESILVFTFKEENNYIVRQLEGRLISAGIDLEARLVSGARRISFSTWGKHTTDNSFSECEHVVLMGVLRMPRIAFAASMAGQKDNLLYRMPSEELHAAELSELASHIMQAMNRGRCRRVSSDGKALTMTTHLLTKEIGLQGVLQKAMRGLQWETLKIEACRPVTKTQNAAAQIFEHLLSLPENTLKISKKVVFSSLNIDLASAAKAQAMERAMKLLEAHSSKNLEPCWKSTGHSIVREVKTAETLAEILEGLIMTSLASNKNLMEVAEAI